jgi:hypothetical protein
MSEYLARGLRPDDRTPVNSGFLVQCQNQRITGMGPNTFTPIADPFAANYLLTRSLNFSWPFPQVFKGKKITLLAHATSVWTVTESAGPSWTLTQQTTVDGRSIGTAKSITSYFSWHFADFGPVWMLFNGHDVVFRTAADTMFGSSVDTRVLDDLTISSGASNRGRVMMGGFRTTGMWNAQWENVLRGSYDIGLGLSFPVELGTNFVWWSQIGDGAFFLLYPDQYIDGMFQQDDTEGYTKARPMYRDMLERNEMGFMPMDWQGSIHKILAFDKGFMVYGDGGATYLYPANNTYGKQEVLPCGIAARDAAGGTEKEQVFVDDSGFLWILTAGKEPERLGYREFFEPMLTHGIMVSYDQYEKEYHISGDTNSPVCYILNVSDPKNKVLYSSTYMVNSIVSSYGVGTGTYGRSSFQTSGTLTVGNVYHIDIYNSNDDFVNVGAASNTVGVTFTATGTTPTHWAHASQLSNTTDAYTYITTDVFDLGLRSLKTIENAALGVTATAGVDVAIDWRNTTGTAWVRTAYSRANHEGIAYFPITGLEFRIVVRSASYTTIDLDTIHVHVKIHDRRTIRGPYNIPGVERGIT